MFLDVSALYLLERQRTYEGDRRRELREALRREALLGECGPEVTSVDVTRVSSGDRAGRVGDRGADLGRCHDLDPSPGTQ